MPYLDETENPVITRCGQVRDGKECRERLMVNAGKQPEGALCYHAVCPICGIVPIFPQLGNQSGAQSV